MACDSSDDRVGIFGGSDDYNWQNLPPPPVANDPLNHYESYRIAWRVSPPAVLVVEQKTTNPGPTPRVYAGPTLTPPLIGLTEYPRVHVLTTSQWIVSGFNTVSTRWTHDPTQDPTYQFDTGQITANYDQMVFYGTSLLYPNFGGVYNRLVRIGGQRWTVSWASYASNMVEVSYAASPGDFWASGTSGLYRMVSTRYQGNVVILPSGNLFAIGGYTDDRSPRP